MGAPLDPVPHSPLPWSVDYSDPLSSAIGSIESGDGWSVATIWNDIHELPARENAEFICRACNSHAALVEALKECSFRLAALVAASGDFSDVNAKALDAATAALAKAETE